MSRAVPGSALRTAAAVLALFAAMTPASAVVVLDSTWSREGGTKGKPWAGFGAHLKLAAEPQFAAVVALAGDGETWGEASGTWIGNSGGFGYVLTAAHIYDLPASPDAYAIRSPGGRIHRVDRIWIHPEWNGDTDTRTGFDLAILRLTAPMTDAGPAPALYVGNAEAGKVITFVGFGSRGIGSTGQQDRFYRGSEKAAAQGMVDQWVPPAVPVPSEADGGNYLGVFLPREDGGIDNPYGGSAKPATPLVGLLGSGDSGGSAWMPTAAGWAIVGVNSNGDGEARYGESSWFARVAPHRDWIAGIVPGVKFVR